MKQINNWLTAQWQMSTGMHSSREAIVDYQKRQLRRLVHHAYENVPYYRELFDRHGLKPQDIRSVSDLSMIPVSDKDDLRSRPRQEIIACGTNLQRLIVTSTSGSSGKPFTIYSTWLEQRLLRAIRIQAMNEFGRRWSDSIAMIAFLRPKQPAANPLIQRLLRNLSPRRWTQIDCREPLEDILRSLRSFRPDVIVGYAGVISRVSQLMSDTDRQQIRPRFLQVDSEVLTPLMRRQITYGFGAPVFEMYDSHEFNLMAWECPVTGEMHVSDYGMILEVLCDGRPVREGERGEVVGTNLHAYTMPFIRYRLGDIVTKGSERCRCGKPFSTIRAVQGRMIDYFTLIDGRTIHPYSLLKPILEVAPWIREYQLLQERKDRVVLHVVAVATPSKTDLTRLQESVIGQLGPEVAFEVALVPNISLETTGKFRVARSLVKSAYDEMQWEDGRMP
ncbi:MAG: hypothetical protein U0586_14385 [Candidatus Brocadiaceae bacterium]